MKSDKIKSALEDDRRVTDVNLIAERTKTNHSIERAEEWNERQRDDNVRTERVRFDTQVARDRDDSDRRRDRSRASRGYTHAQEQGLGDERLVAERTRSDRAVSNERVQADMATVRERTLRGQIAERLLGKERLLTDQSLRAERFKTDAQIKRGSRRLKREVADHLRTKVSLTTRDEFLAIVSHDLRNPIGAASSCLEMLLDDPPANGLIEDTKYWIEFSKRNVDTALRLIANLLDIERIAHGKLELDLDVMDVKAVIQETIHTFSYVPSSRRLVLRAVECAEPAFITADHDRVLQVLSNLVGNAIKYTPAGGEVSIVTEVSGPDVLIKVCDNGAGIPSDRVHRIFERFEQVESKDRRSLGLGLYIARMFVEAHGGKIWVDSAPGVGSTFALTLPRAGPPVEPQSS